MTREGRLIFWLIALAIFVGLLWLLRGILLPFVAGMAIAYFLDPLADRLERYGFSRTLATVTITLTFFLVVLIVVLLLAPVIGDQITGFAQRVPGYVQQLMHRGEPLWRTVKTYLSPRDIEKLRSAAGDYAGTVAGWLGTVFERLVSESLVVANLLSLIFVTPVVTFYFLLDWHRVTALIEKLMPRQHAGVINRELAQIDSILSGFVRGQALVCLSLALFYGIGLTLVGLDLGLVVGLVSGILSFAPFLGTVSGLVVGIALGFAQSSSWTLPAMVAGVFLVGNLLEGNLLAPRLVGSKIGLHPVWVIFALLAGGALFGFLGLLLAVPTAAVIGVLARFAVGHYLASPLYSGDAPLPGVGNPPLTPGDNPQPPPPA